MKRSKLMLCLCLFAVAASTVKAAPRDTPEVSSPIVIATAGEALEVGYIAVSRAPDGLVWAATDANTNAVVVLGRIETAAASNDVVVVKPGIFKWTNAGAFTAKDVGQYAYVLGAGSVTTKAIATNDFVVGRILRVESDGVWVHTNL